MKTRKKFKLREEDLQTCIESCIQDPFCLGYGHVSPVDCILMISNLGGDFTISEEDINENDIAVNETDLLFGDYSWLLFQFNVEHVQLEKCMTTQFK